MKVSLKTNRLSCSVTFPNYFKKINTQSLTEISLDISKETGSCTVALPKRNYQFSYNL